MHTIDYEALQRRVELLERSCRLGKLILGVVGVVLVAILVIAAGRPKDDVIEAEKIVVKDKAGIQRIR